MFAYLKSLLLLPSLLLLISCEGLVKFADPSYSEIISAQGHDHVKIVFSHNIHAETHPCGCRKFPLGGLPQVAALFDQLNKSSPLIYVDTGDMLFDSSVVPASLEQSSKYKAEKLAQAQSMLGLKFFLPGDQDLALGEAFLNITLKERNITTLITNLKKESSLSSNRQWSSIQIAQTPLSHVIYFLGVIDPKLMQMPFAAKLEEPLKSLEKAVTQILKRSGKEKQTLILLSHSGIEADREYAKKFPQLDWIIGAHSQSFLKTPEKEGEVNIVQGLSRNHYIGVISIPLGDRGASYELMPVHEALEKKLDPNPLSTWLSDYKSELDKIYLNEQKALTTSTSNAKRSATYLSCKECHQAQTEFWQGTSHSLAWQTLRRAQASNNSSCIECHSLDYKRPSGFLVSQDIVQGKELDHKRYWEEVDQVFKTEKPIREMTKTERQKASQKWVKIDESKEVSHNFANVQCLHCHQQPSDHPFDIGQEKPSSAQKKEFMIGQCLKCHTSDQSPEWYLKDEKGLATSPDSAYLERKLKEIACPIE